MDLATTENAKILWASFVMFGSVIGEKVGTERRSASVKGIKGMENSCNECDASYSAHSTLIICTAREHASYGGVGDVIWSLTAGCDSEDNNRTSLTIS